MTNSPVINIIDCPVCDSEACVPVVERFDRERLVKCADCGHVYLNPTMCADRVRDIHNGYHASDDEASYMKTVDAWFNDPAGPYQYAASEVARTAGGFSGKRVLDIGCGAGRFLAFCRDRGARVTGIDSSQRSVDLAKRRFQLDVNMSEVTKWCASNPQLHGSFDMVFAFEVIEHIHQPAKFLEAIELLLAPGGRVFISTPNFHLYYLMGRAAPALTQCAEHIQYFDPDTLRKLFGRRGFDDIKCTSINPISYGGRVKQVLAKKKIINGIWRIVRRANWAYRVKDRMFSALEKDRAEDAASKSGGTLVCSARKA